VHPFLARPASFAVYLIAWVPLTAILGALLVLAGGMSPLEAAAVSPLLTGVYAFVCLSSWYLCVAFPIRSSHLVPLAITLTVASLVAASLWVLWGATLGALLALAPPFAALPESLRRATPVVLLLGILLYLLAVALHYLLAAAREAKEREEREVELKSLARDAELSALKERLNPHFLFNALNSIASLAATRPDEARRMCALLSDFLRTTLGLSGKAQIPLGEEIALARRYLAVERVRFGDRLGIAEDLDPAAADALVPPLLLQPLVENAVKHGIAGRLDGGTLTLATKRVGSRVSVVVENPVDADAAAARPTGTGMGLANVARRVEASWGSAGRFAARRVDSTFRVEIELPAPA
jgi:two-component system, LytTR family, sensor histidine kinase AlgZ